MTLFHQDIDAEFERLRALEATALLTDPAPPEFDLPCHRARARLDLPVAMVTVLDGDRLVMRACAGLRPRAMSRRHQFCNEAVRRDEGLVVPDAQEDARFAENCFMARPPFLRFYTGVPLSYTRGVRLGALCLRDHRPRESSPDDRADLETMAAGVVSAALERQFERIAARPIHRGGGRRQASRSSRPSARSASSVSRALR